MENIQSDEVQTLDLMSEMLTEEEILDYYNEMNYELERLYENEDLR